MSSFKKHWPIGVFIFYICLMAPAIFACETTLNLNVIDGFESRGTLGKDGKYIQRVYSGNRMSFSTITFPAKEIFDKERAMQETARGMVKTVLGQTKNFEPNVKVLHEELLPQLDSRLAFLSYVEHGSGVSVNVEAAGVIKDRECWAILRFTALSKKTKEEALNRFADLIKATRLN